MNTISEKKFYCMPEIIQIKLDNEISLVLTSGDPDDPYLSNTPDYFHSDPFKINLG